MLNVAKPPGMTSRDVVNHVQRLVRPHKVGHAGTLDPLATGVLVLCLGHATRLIEYVQEQRKSYRGSFLLGQESDTEDSTGEVRTLVSPVIPTLEQIQAALPCFIGAIEQRPPVYSALKVKGQRAYDLARQGKEVDLAPRTIEVYDLRIVSYVYPELVLDIECGSGTYVRSLGRDLAESLGTAAVMSALVRTAIGVFPLTESVTLDSLNAESIAAHLLSPRSAVAHLPLLTISDAEQLRLIQGKRIAAPVDDPASELAAINVAGQLIAVVQRTPEGDLRSTRVFLPGMN